jgi:hypothetical protein
MKFRPLLADEPNSYQKVLLTIAINPQMVYADTDQ